MIINETFVSFLDCRRKAYLKACGQTGQPHDLEQVQLGPDAAYRHSALDHFLAGHDESKGCRCPASLEEAIQSRPNFIVATTAQSGDVCSHLDLLERLDGGTGSEAAYAPVLFVSRSKVTRADRLLLAFQGHAGTASRGPSHFGASEE